MKHAYIFVIIGLSIFGYGAPPAFFDAETLKVNGVPIKLAWGEASPFVFDWNGDGKKDLVAGQMMLGYIYYFENTGTDAEPVLAAGQNIYADGVPISLPGT